MNESLLNALLKLFAIIVDVKHFKTPDVARLVVKDYFEKEYGRSQAKRCLVYFDDHLNEYHQYTKKYEKKDISVYDSRIEEICTKINSEFEQKQKIWLCLQLVEFLDDTGFTGMEEVNLVKKIAESFNIDEDDFEQAKNLILRDVHSLKLTDKLLIIDGQKNFLHPKARHLYKKNMTVRIFVLQLKKSDTYLFKYAGDQNLFLNGLNIQPNRAYVWGMGAVIWGSRIKRVYYGEMVNAFSFKDNSLRVEFKASKVSYNFFNSKNGLKEFDFDAESGQLIGIVGSSGSGKSTFLNVLNGNLTQKTGKITINGYDIHENKETLKGITGYVPQEDLLVEELTVYQNLYYNARLCFKDYNEKQIDELIKKTIVDFDLKEATDLKVGDPINKVLSGGQRKRLNIALELMREPALLFADEPTSGLSSMDSEKILNLLKRQTFKDKLVILTIHQPSSDLFKLFDKILVIDQGGRLIFSGNPLDGVAYFRKNANFINPQETECVTCGNIKSEQILQIVEARLVNEFGKLTRKRKRLPEEWEETYKNETSTKAVEIVNEKKPLPGTNFKTPGKTEQFKIFFRRTLLSKLSNRQYVLMILLEAPLLAIILGLFTKDFNGPENKPDLYIFANNENLPAYIFMSVVVALFLGMIVSAEEIIRDKKIIKRESFLNLSRWSYINSKTLFLAVISAIQALLFVLIGNLILEINGMTFYYWLMFFSTAVCANLIGLNISSAFNTVVSSYIAIPFILVPQLLLSGVVVDFNKIHKNLKSLDYTPLFSDVMTSRWAYEGLIVEQFKDNPFQKHFYDVEQNLSQLNYINTFYKQKLQSIYSNLCVASQNESGFKPEKDLRLLKNELNKLAQRTNDNSITQLASRLDNEFNTPLFKKDFSEKMADIEKSSLKKLEQYKIEKENIYHSLVKKLGSQKAFIQFQHKNHNKAISVLVENRYSHKKITIYDEKIIQLKDPIYRMPESKIGRAHFYAPVKKIGNVYIGTYWFNLLVIWAMSTIMYILLQYDILRKGMVYLESIRVTKGWSKKVLRV
jgi:ABC transport system ATP-binding/permease protein